MTASTVVKQAAAPNVVVWIDTGQLIDMVDAWTASSFKAGTYDFGRHAQIADLTLTVQELDQVIAPLLGDTMGRRALRSLQDRRQVLVDEVLELLGGEYA